MKIMIDTNILFSAAVFRSQKINTVIEKIAVEHTLVLCSYIVDELYRVVERKKPDLLRAIYSLRIENNTKQHSPVKKWFQTVGCSP